MKVTYSQEKEPQANWNSILEHPGWFRKSSVTCGTKAFPIHMHLLVHTTQWMEDVKKERATEEKKKKKRRKIKFSCIEVDQGGKSIAQCT